MQRSCGRRPTSWPQRFRLTIMPRSECQAGNKMPSGEVFPHQRISVSIAGREYRFSLDFADLAKGEEYYRAQGFRFNLITSIPAMRRQLRAAVEVTACSLRAHHPDVHPALLFECFDEVVDTLVGAWPPMSKQTREANENLLFDLDAMADAAEQFTLLGEWMPLSCLIGGLSLAGVVNAFPCA